MSQEQSWKQNLSFLCPTAIDHEVHGKTIRFYPISGRMLFKLRGIARPLAHAISVLFADKSNDTSRQMHDFAFKDEDGSEGERGSQTIISAITPELLRERTQQKEMAIDKLVDAVMNESNSLLIAEMIFDSCRDVFPRKPSTADLEIFLQECSDFVSLTSFLVGVGKANVQVFGPAAGKVSRAFKERMGALQEEETLGKEESGLGESAPSMPPASTASPTPPAASQPPIPPAPPTPFPAPPMTTPSPGS